ncbi:hypothetical protein [Chlorobium phaeovibrioides]|uniref:Uncharacterized protein n=1 Tax=Chlorobium phaeovibrioides TaxID=1094 RepID=A0ABW9UT37_CHLPH|nr:hypothetical protein [Chlorobium phaeovibrioides]MWV55236.1 hypothetical protein [Chlorobium phaeovibrioides]HCD37094.1 hypothetical protein [Chlorobium sp.]
MKKIVFAASLAMVLMAGSAYADNDVINGVNGVVTNSEGSSSSSIGVSSVEISNADRIWLFLAQYFGY